MAKAAKEALVAECLECEWEWNIDSRKEADECPDCGAKNIDVYAAKHRKPHPRKSYGVQFTFDGLNRWEYFPREFTHPGFARRNVLRTYTGCKIERVVEVEDYPDLVNRFAKK